MSFPLDRHLEQARTMRRGEETKGWAAKKLPIDTTKLDSGMQTVSRCLVHARLWKVGSLRYSGESVGDSPEDHKLVHDKG